MVKAKYDGQSLQEAKTGRLVHAMCSVKTKIYK